MVGRLVEEQQFGRRNELRREPDAPALAAAERRDGACLRFLGVEAEALEHRVDAGVKGVAAHVGEAFLVVTELYEDTVGGPFAEHRELGRLSGERVLERDDVGEGRGGRVPDRHDAFERAVLIEERMPEPGAARDAAGRGHHAAGDDPEERALAAAVAPDDAPALTFGDREGDVFEEHSGAERDADVGAGQQGHGNA